MKVSLKMAKSKVKAKKNFQTEIALLATGKTMWCTEVASGTTSKTKPKDRASGKMVKE